MILIYCLVARGSVIISECANPNVTGNFVDVCKRVFRKVKSKKHAHKVTYVKEGHTFNFLLRNETTFMCMCDEEYGRVLPFNFLTEIATLFEEKYQSDITDQDNMLDDDDHKMEEGGDHGDTHYDNNNNNNNSLPMTHLGEGNKNSFKAVLAGTMKKYLNKNSNGHNNNNNNQNTDTIGQIELQVREVTTQMQQNIDKAIERNDLITNLVNKTDNLSTSATFYKKKSTKLHHSLCIASVKYKAAVIAIILLALYFIGASFCGLHFGDCI